MVCLSEMFQSEWNSDPFEGAQGGVDDGSGARLYTEAGIICILARKRSLLIDVAICRCVYSECELFWANLARL